MFPRTCRMVFFIFIQSQPPHMMPKTIFCNFPSSKIYSTNNDKDKSSQMYCKCKPWVTIDTFLCTSKKLHSSKGSRKPCFKFRIIFITRTQLTPSLQSITELFCHCFPLLYMNYCHLQVGSPKSQLHLNAPPPPPPTFNSKRAGLVGQNSERSLTLLLCFSITFSILGCRTSMNLQV